MIVDGRVLLVDFASIQAVEQPSSVKRRVVTLERLYSVVLVRGDGQSRVISSGMSALFPPFKDRLLLI